MQINTTLISQVSQDLEGMLGDDFDPETFWDTLDGETDALDIADVLLRKRSAAKAMGDAAKAQADDLAARSRRFAERAKACDKALHTLLSASGQRKVERPEGTVSLRKGAMSVAITDESQIPAQLCKTTVSPDKTAIKAQLQAGEVVPGAELTQGAEGVTVRVK